MTPSEVRDVFVVVRTAGERTAAAATALAADQVGYDHCVAIREVPFAAALRRGLEIGAEAGHAWTLCLDGDVLLRPGAIANLVAEAETAPATAFGQAALVVDLLMGQVRDAGVHLYRTSLIPEALAEGAFRVDLIRPENTLKLQMAARGHPWQSGRTVVGLHDYEQSFADIFRKAYVHAAKFRMELDAYTIDYWHRAGREDPDLRVASWAPAIHDLMGERVLIDRRRFPERLDTLLILAGLSEKPPLAGITAEEVEARLAAFVPPPEYQAFRRFCLLYQRGTLGRVRALLDRHGVLGTPAHLGARALDWCARRLQACSRPNENLKPRPHANPDRRPDTG